MKTIRAGITTLFFILFLSSLLACAHKPAAEGSKSSGNSEGLYQKHQGQKNNSYAKVNDRNETEGCPIEDASPEKRASFAQLRKACAADIEKFCKDIECTELMKPVQVCLMMESDQISAACKKDINRHIEAFQPSVRPLE